MSLDLLKTNFFHAAMPARPMGKYAHIVVLRETKGYALFQTDGELNRSRVSKGVIDEDFMTRITMFKRKQTTPERLNGRELLRSLDLMSEECQYNVQSCKRCADCITYGFAVGDGGSEKSKVYSDTAFSLTDYANSQEIVTLNAPYESGTMSDETGQVSSRINQKDYVKPQVFFPSVMTTRDLTSNLFFYVLNNIMRTERYGATTTRGGTVKNHVLAIILNNGEIFSNLLLTQHLHDEIKHTSKDPIRFSKVRSATDTVITTLLGASNTSEQQVLMGADLQTFLSSVQQMPQEAVLEALKAATKDRENYSDENIMKGKKK